jgi:adenine C2-methylase RlmN of 23S rRNA A2503 and tRNA A37
VDHLQEESRPSSPDGGKRTSTGSTSGWNTTLKKLAAAILQVSWSFFLHAFATPFP